MLKCFFNAFYDRLGGIGGSRNNVYVPCALFIKDLGNNALVFDSFPCPSVYGIVEIDGIVVRIFRIIIDPFHVDRNNLSVLNDDRRLYGVFEQGIFRLVDTVRFGHVGSVSITGCRLLFLFFVSAIFIFFMGSRIRLSGIITVFCSALFIVFVIFFIRRIFGRLPQHGFDTPQNSL